ncbi:MAG TPA: flagellar biosynthesis protein FlhB [Clostridiaceae bacterium]|jgi:flagellar biosynthetic protein FlhB|nr:flagellar biosynthesis protein FlhB [Clostridiaceae bacterium]
MEVNKINIIVDLQLFAEDKDAKTEKATPKRRQDARKKGQIFQSREITSALVLISVFLGLKALKSNIYGEFKILTQRVFTQFIDTDEYFTQNGIWRLTVDVLRSFAIIAGPIILISLAVGFVSSYSQVGFLFTTETLKIKLGRINPLLGLKRMFSPRGLIELLKAFVKIIIVGYVTYSSLNNETTNILVLMKIGVNETGIYIIDTAIVTALNICIALAIFGFIDYGWQWWEYERNLRMTKEEIKEEYKQIEGNPEIKSRIKQKQRQMSMRRMMHEVPKADVIITNPTHIAVAMKYDATIDEAPVVVAKGEGYIAMKIKEIAKANNIEIVENRELARTIYETVDIGEAIPPELYQAVAEILAYVYSLKNANVRGGV